MALMVAAMMLAWSGAAYAALPADGASVDAAGLTAGPFITSAGLVWESSSGIMLTDTAGKSTVLAPSDAPNWDGLKDLAWFGLAQWAVARPSGVFAGRIGDRMSELPPLSRCNPATRSPTSAGTLTQYAVSGDHLYAALVARCFARRSVRLGAVVVDVNLRSRRAHELVSVPGTLGSIAAAGKYLAIAYWPSPRWTGVGPGPNTVSSNPETPSPRRLLVRVLNAYTGALVNQVTPPASAPAFLREYASGIQVDGYGDVLVTAGQGLVTPGQLAHSAQPPERSGWWWARARSAVGRETRLGPNAVLSAGRVAFLSFRAINADETIEVRNLLTGTTRTIVAFTGSMKTRGLGLSGNGLAWAQQSSVVDVVRTPLASGGSLYACVPVPLGPVQLASLDLRHIPSSPVLVTGVAVPPRYANEPPCIEA